METTIILERSSKHFMRFMKLLSENNELRIKDVKKVISQSSYYAIVLRKIYKLNNLLRKINPNFYLAEPHFIFQGDRKVYTALKRCKLVEIDIKKEFFILKYGTKK